MPTSSQRPPSQRQLQVGEEIRHALSDVFAREDFYDPETYEELMITVSEVSISADLRNATVFVMPPAGRNKERTMALLARLAPKLRSLVAKKIKMRYMPEFYFKLDTLFERVSHIDELLNRPEVKRDIEKPGEE